MGVGQRERIARRINDKLASLREQTTYPDPAAQSKAQSDIDLIASEAERLRFALTAKRKSLAEEPRLSSTELMGRFFGHQDDPALGTVIYKYFSAVGHGSAHGLMVSLGKDQAVGAPDGSLLAPLRVGSDEVCSV